MQPGDHVLCGWRVRSALPLPELLPWAGAADHPPDVVIQSGNVPVQPGQHWVTVTPDGAVCLTIRNLVHILVEDGRRITVDIRGQERAPGWRLFLLGAAIGFLCHQRGVFPLHAATLTVGGRTVALAGESGAGKSTLAYALIRRGHQLLSDDLTVLNVAASGVDVLPAFPRLKLWQDSLQAMGEATDGLEPVRDGLDKFDLRPRDGFDPAPRRLDAIYILRKGDGPLVTPIAPVAAMPLIASNIARPWVARLLGRQPALFADTVSIVQQVPVLRLFRPMAFDLLEETARQLEATS